MTHRVTVFALAVMLALVLLVAPTSEAHNVAKGSNFSCTSTAQQVVAPSSTTVALSIFNNAASGGTVIYFSDNSEVTLTSSTGFPLPGQAAFFFTPGYTGAIWCITASGTADLRYLKEAK
jgi:hypothetical protein